MPHRSWSTSAHRRLVVRMQLARTHIMFKGWFSRALGTNFFFSFLPLSLGKEIRSILFEQFAGPDTRSADYLFCNWGGILMFVTPSEFKWYLLKIASTFICIDRVRNGDMMKQTQLLLAISILTVNHLQSWYFWLVASLRWWRSMLNNSRFPFYRNFLWSKVGKISQWQDLFAIAQDQPFRFPSTFTFVLRAFSTLEGALSHPDTL